MNEGSLRKHLTCHPETAQLSTSLRMWPCSVCQAVFTHESGKVQITLQVTNKFLFWIKKEMEIIDGKEALNTSHF